MKRIYLDIWFLIHLDLNFYNKMIKYRGNNSSNTDKSAFIEITMTPVPSTDAANKANAMIQSGFNYDHYNSFLILWSVNCCTHDHRAWEDPIIEMEKKKKKKMEMIWLQLMLNFYKTAIKNI